MNDTGAHERLIEQLNAHAPPCLVTLGGAVETFDAASGELTMSFRIGPAFCHSGDVVQGGFVTAMLDAAMAHAVIMSAGEAVGIPTLDLSVSFLAPTRAGQHMATGRVLRVGGRIAFAEAKLRNESGEITARGASTVIVARR